MKKTVGTLRQVYQSALKRFPEHKNTIGAWYERIIARQVGNRITWVSSKEELTGTTANMLIDFEAFVSRLRSGVQTSPCPPVVLRGGKG